MFKIDPQQNSISLLDAKRPALLTPSKSAIVLRATIRLKQ